MRYQTTGAPYGGQAGSDQASWPLMERLVRAAVGRGAIAPDWEVQTAHLQGLNNLGMAGLTEEERAGRQSRLLPAPGQDGAADTPYSFCPVMLDLDGDGLELQDRNQSGIAWNVDDSGYLKQTGWIKAEGAQTDAFLTLDRDLNGRIDGGRELFSNGQVEAGLRGVSSLKWLDANGDGQISAADPVWQSLGLWQDQNGNGTQDAGETQTLGGQGITALDYTMGRYTLTTAQGQITRQLASPELAADREGSVVYPVPEGLVVQSSTGQVTLFATKVDDRSVLSPGQDGVNGYEDTELLIAPADLLANDTLGGLLGHELSITGVGQASHGSVRLDANGMVRFMPEANYFGVAGFTYNLSAPTGQTSTASVSVTLANLNDAPSVTVSQDARAVYGYEYLDYRWSNLGGMEYVYLNPRYTPYSGIDYSQMAVTGVTLLRISQHPRCLGG